MVFSSLDGNSIGDEGAKALAVALKANSTLQLLKYVEWMGKQVQE